MPLDEQDLQDHNTDKEYVSELGKQKTQVATLSEYRTTAGYSFNQVDIAYQTIGKLSPRKDNAILICHALSGSALVAGIDEQSGRPGWWDFHVGPGKTIDTDKFFIISSNVIGGCNGSTGPSSINPETGQPYGTEFPLITIRDMVRAQVMLLEHLGIKKLFSVVGGSMGGMQALIWAVEYPEMVQTCIPIASCMAQSAMQIAFSEVGRQAILSDPNWQNGNYFEKERPEHGLAVARMIGHITYLSEYSMRKKFGRRIQEPAAESDGGVPFPVFSVESYLRYQGGNFVKRFDPSSYLYITKAMNMFDLLNNRTPDDVLSGVLARFLVVSFASDWLYPPAQSRELVRCLKRAKVRVTYANLETQYGHDSFLIKNPEFTRIIRNFLNMEYLNLTQQNDVSGELSAS